MRNSTFPIGIVASVAAILSSAPARADGPYIQHVELAGAANLTGANLSSGGDTEANSTLGFVATHERTEDEGGGRFQLSMALGFGAKAAQTTIASRDDYVNFLRSPSSTLGVNLTVLDLWTFRNSSFQVGITGNFRAYGNTFKFNVKDSTTLETESKTQDIGLMILEPSAATQVTLDAKRQVFALLQLGVTTRFWCKPHEAFAESLGSSEHMRGHAYWGPRASFAIYAGRVYGGVELVRLWGSEGDSQLRQFAVLPYIGITGGLTIKSPEPKNDTAAASSSEQGADTTKAEGTPIPTERPSTGTAVTPLIH